MQGPIWVIFENVDLAFAQKARQLFFLFGEMVLRSPDHEQTAWVNRTVNCFSLVHFCSWWPCPIDNEIISWQKNCYYFCILNNSRLLCLILWTFCNEASTRVAKRDFQRIPPYEMQTVEKNALMGPRITFLYQWPIMSQVCSNILNDSVVSMSFLCSSSVPLWSGWSWDQGPFLDWHKPLFPKQPKNDRFGWHKSSLCVAGELHTRTTQCCGPTYAKI